MRGSVVSVLHARQAVLCGEIKGRCVKKKSVALVIAAVFFASIVIVGFFGMRVVSYNEKIYISEIRLTNPEIRASTDGSRYMIFDYRDGLTIPFTFDVLPENATERNSVEVRIVSQSDEGVAEFISGNLIVYKPGSFTVRAMSTDGRNVVAGCDVYIRQA